MSGYTKGPWTLSSDGYRILGSGNAHGLIDKQIAFTAHNQKTRTPENAANARLIAAAPTAHELIARAVTDRIDDQWLREARIYLEAVNGNS